MAKFKFFPEDYELDDKLLKWTKSKGLTDNQIEEQLEYIKVHEFSPMRSCPRRTWQKWVLNSIRYGHVVPVIEREYRKPQQLSNEQRAADILAFERDPLIKRAKQ